VITAPSVFLEVLNFKGVQDGGAAYTDEAQKPAAQIFSNNVEVVAYGSVNSPIAGSTNWLQNSMWIEAQAPGNPVFLDYSAVGGGFQALNFGVTGDAIVTSGSTLTPFALVGLSQGVIIPPFLVANGGSQLIIQATGNMDVVGPVPIPGLLPGGLQFPGGVVLKADGYLSVNTPIFNAWTATAQPWQGVFLESPQIIAGSYFAVNGNSWVNYSSVPVTGPGTTYRITNPSPGQYAFVLAPEAVHHNTYSRVVVGGVICTAVAPPWVPGC
jgi:hypothetical protein